MAATTDEILFGSCVGGLSFVLGLVAFWLGHTEFGRIWPHPLVSWGIIGTGLVLVGLGFFLMGLKIGVSLPGEGILAMLAESPGYYVLMGGFLVSGVWAPWVYLQQCLYTTKEVIVSGKLRVEHERTHRLRRSQLAAVAAGLGAVVGLVATGTIVSFSSTAPQGDLVPIAVATSMGCVGGGVVFGVVFLALKIWFRRDLVAA